MFNPFRLADRPQRPSNPTPIASAPRLTSLPRRAAVFFLDRFQPGARRLRAWSGALLGRLLPSLDRSQPALVVAAAPVAQAPREPGPPPVRTGLFTAENQAPVKAILLQVDQLRQSLPLSTPKNATEAQQYRGKWGSHLRHVAEDAAACLEDRFLPVQQLQELNLDGPQLRGQSDRVLTLETTLEILKQLNEEVEFSLRKERARLYEQTFGVMRLVQALHRNPAIGAVTRCALKRHLDAMRRYLDHKNKKISQSRRRRSQAA